MICMASSGPLGRFIDMPTSVIIFWRCVLGGIFLYVFCRLIKVDLRVKRENGPILLLGALFMGIHWVTYFMTLKLTSVAVGMLTIASNPVLTSLLEPMLLRTKFQRSSLLAGVLIIIGVYCLIPDFDVESDFTRGVLLGLFSSLCYSIRNIIMKKLSFHYHGTCMMFYQLLLLIPMLFPFLLVNGNDGFLDFWPQILLLSLITTATGHTIFVMTIGRFPVSTASILGSLQPVYGVILAALFLSETPNFSAYLGGAIIIAAVTLESAKAILIEKHAKS